MTRELLRRHSGNPILSPGDLPFLCNAIYNPGAVKAGDRYVLLPRVEDGRRDNRLHVAWSDDGVHFQVEPEPIRIPPPPADDLPEKHMYDPRVTHLEGSYYITYCSQDFAETVRIGLLKTEDFKTFERLPYQTAPWSRNSALFPERIGGRYARFERPMSGNQVVNLIAYSPDLAHWGGWEPIRIEPQTWLREKWGGGPPPIKTERGWLLIIHGVWLACNYVYRIGVLLLDLEEPSQVIGQCPEFILTPTEPYERVGETLNCVFCNGAIVEESGEVKVYYGAADTCIGLATASLEELVGACRRGRA
jgi:predicted GH43/DUF377 family glycosyl hydrolase